MSSEVILTGLDELHEDLRKAMKRYPDKSIEVMEQTGKKFKSRVQQITREATYTHTGNLIKGYKLDPVRGYGSSVSVDFSGTAPHFHLIENGHNIVKQKSRKGKVLEGGGQVIGFVPGRLIVHQAREEYKQQLPKIMEELLTELLKESDLL